QSLVAERAPPHLVIGPHHHALGRDRPFGRRAVFFVLRLDAVADRLAPVEETAMLRFEEAHLRWCVADVNRGPCLAAYPLSCNDKDADRIGPGLCKRHFLCRGTLSYRSLHRCPNELKHIARIFVKRFFGAELYRERCFPCRLVRLKHRDRRTVAATVDDARD